MTEWTEERIQEQLAVCEAATEGPWEVVSGPDWWDIRQATDDDRDVRHDGCVVNTGCEGEVTVGWQDAAFIATARTGYPDALRELVSLREENSRLRECLRVRKEWIQEDREDGDCGYCYAIDGDHYSHCVEVTHPLKVQGE